MGNSSRIATLAVLIVTIFLIDCSEDRDPLTSTRQPEASALFEPAPHSRTYPEVWSSNGPDGQTYEFKVNCSGNHDILETCYLFALSDVIVIDPTGAEFELSKDFNVNAYSGEVTRRWVLYGPSNQGAPTPGEYIFRYYRSGELDLEESVDYTPEIVGYPRDVSWIRDGSDLLVSWVPPGRVTQDMWYKVLVFPEDGEVISLQFDWNVSEGCLFVDRQR